VTNKSAANRYARALFDVAHKEQVDFDEVDRQLTAFSDVCTQNPMLDAALMNPAVPAPRKRAVVAELVKVLAMTPVVAKLLVLLAERDRLVLLPDLAAAYRDRVLEHQQVVRAVVTTAVPLASDRTAAIEQSLARLTGRKVTLSTRVDPALVGGLVARIGSTVYDASVSAQLKKMKQRLVESM
jgi:F-type H+-transporting ATPase subunit delta